jgi:valyl-tRNA synthetase
LSRNIKDGNGAPGDAELADPELGSGAVKITPAHDPNDLACAERHGLDVVTIIGDDGCINAAGARDCAQFVGMERFDARDELVRQLTGKGVYRGAESHEMRLGLCSRSGDVLEPLLKPQWFVALKDMAMEADQAVRSGLVSVEPSWQQAEWHRWLDDAPDWCISRQLWWGHRIPAYRVCGGGSSDEGSAEEAVGRWVVGRSHAEAEALATEQFGDNWTHLEQDEDVLDTWFSSGLFPLSALGWPSKATADGAGSLPLDAAAPAPASSFYPLSVMETGSDILFFWVARMMMLCATLEPGGAAEKAAPFKRVLLHPLVR